jgi:hypothetical protein
MWSKVHDASGASNPTILSRVQADAATL